MNKIIIEHLQIKNNIIHKLSLFFEYLDTVVILTLANLDTANNTDKVNIISNQ
jgi:hypothetical protein